MQGMRVAAEPPFRTSLCYRVHHDTEWQRLKKSSPLPLWEFRLPVKALALSALRPFGPARFARGLDEKRSMLILNMK